MNRRSFLTRLGLAAASAAALDVLDPEKLLWVPGAKTIIDLGATKHLEAPTDGQVAALFDAHSAVVLDPRVAKVIARQTRIDDYADRDIRLDIGGVSFRYKGDKLVSTHTEAELRLLDKPFWPGGIENAQIKHAHKRSYPGHGQTFTLIDVPEDRE